MKEDHKNNLCNELPDNMLENVTGGIDIGDTINVRNPNITYCSNCAKLLCNYQATVTGVRGVLDGKTIYWVTRHCCGHKSSVIETDIVK